MERNPWQDLCESSILAVKNAARFKGEILVKRESQGPKTCRDVDKMRVFATKKAARSRQPNTLYMARL